MASSPPSTVVLLEPERPATSFDSRQSLPGELEEAVPHRGAVAAVLFGVVFLVMWLGQLAIGFVSGQGYPHRFPWATPEQRAAVHGIAYYMPDVVLATGALIGVGTYALIRRAAVIGRRAHMVSLAFFIASSFLIALAETWGPIPPFLNGISWLAVWLVIYPVMVPSPPRRALTAGLLAASALPLAYAATLFAFGGVAGLAVAAPRVIGCYAAAAAGITASRTIYSLGRKVESARRLGSYNLVEKLGQGGMGQVWRAEHRQLARPAAVKIIKPEHRGSDYADVLRRRFEREARATARLESPHTIEVFDYGSMSDGTFYYVMELLDGIDLDTLVRRFGPQPAERVASIMIQACSSLQEAHEGGLLHRDIKPANLFICRKGPEVDVVKVLDFGLVKSVESHPQSSPSFAGRLTADGMTSGTPAYMAPEAATGSKDVDARSDLYSLGCVAYFLLTGGPVFGGVPMKILLSQVNEAPTLPSLRADLHIHPGLERVVMACLAKRRDDRPATARALADALRALTFDPPWSIARAEAWWREELPKRPLSQPIRAPSEPAPGFVEAATPAPARAAAPPARPPAPEPGDDEAPRTHTADTMPAIDARSPVERGEVPPAAVIGGPPRARH